MKLYIATLWGDIESEDPLIFCDPNEDALVQKVHNHAREMWAEFDPSEPMPSDTTQAIDEMQGRVVFDYLDLPGYGIVSYDLLRNMRLLCLSYEEEMEMALQNAIDDEEVNLAHRDIAFSERLRKEVTEAIR